jgi:hypothetical protein
VNFYFDSCFPRPIADFLKRLAQHADESEAYEHLHDGQPQDAADQDWIPEIARRKDWVIVTADVGGKAGRAAWKSCSCPVLRLYERWVRLRIRDQAVFALKSWDQVVKWARSGECSGSWLINGDGALVNPAGDVRRFL